MNSQAASGPRIHAPSGPSLHLSFPVLLKLSVSRTLLGDINLLWYETFFSSVPFAPFSFVQKNMYVRGPVFIFILIAFYRLLKEKVNKNCAANYLYHNLLCLVHLCVYLFMCVYVLYKSVFVNIY